MIEIETIETAETAVDLPLAGMLPPSSVPARAIVRVDTVAQVPIDLPIDSLQIAGAARGGIENERGMTEETTETLETHEDEKR